MTYPALVFAYVCFAIGGVILIVAVLLIVIFIRRCRRDKLAQQKSAGVMKSSVTSSGSDGTDTTGVYDRRLTGSVSASALGYFQPTSASHEYDNIWYSGLSSSSTTSSTPRRAASSSRRTSPSSSDGRRVPAVPPPRDAGSTSPDHRPQLHRSSPLTALNSIYVIDDHATTGVASPSTAGGRVNRGFVGDGILTDSWRRVSWRARLRAGIAQSTTISSDPGPARKRHVIDAFDRRPSYLSDVIDSVAFFSGTDRHTNLDVAATGTSVAYPLMQLPVDVHAAARRYGSDGGEWTLSRDWDTGVRSNVESGGTSERRRRTDRRHVLDTTYYTYVNKLSLSDESTSEHFTESRLV